MASWTDNPATSSTHVRTIHINEIRSTVDNDRRKAGISPYGWTDDPLTTSTHIRAIHFTEIRTAIQQTPNAPALSDWSVGSPPSPSRQISARDINDLRGWTDQLSAAVGQQFGPEALSNQGIVSFSYDPTSGYTIVGPNTAWMDDVGALKPNDDKLLVRTAIQANQGNNTLGSPGYPEFQAAMDAWSGRGFSVAAVLPREFDRPELNMLCPNGALGEGGNDLLNAYIDDFTLRAEDFARNLAGHNLTTFWVWNEPNVHQVNTGDNCPPPAGNTDLSPQVFGAMLVQGCTRIKAGAQQAGYTAVTYAGSLSVLEGLTA